MIASNTLPSRLTSKIHNYPRCCYLTKNGPQNSGPFFWTFEMNVNSSGFFFLMVQRRASGEFIDAYVWLGRPQPKYKRRWCASKCVSRRKSPKQKTPVRIQQNNREQKWIFPWPTQNGTFFCKYLTALLFTSSRLFSAFQDDVQMSGFDLNGLFECLCPPAKGRSRSLALCIWKKLPLRSLCGTSCRLRA